MAKIELSTTKWTVRSTYKKQKQLNFEMAVQRKENNWDNEKQSLFIHSLIYGYPTPSFFVIEQSEENGEKLKNAIYHLADGKQRTTTIIQFKNDGFKLHDNTPSIIDEEGNEIEISGKLYSELPKEIQDEFDDCNLMVAYLKNITEDEIEEMFFRLNNGVPLSKMEMTRARAGSELMNFINDVSQMPFFSDTISLTGLMKKRFVDQEIILQILQYLIDGSTDFSGKVVQQFAVDMRKEGIEEDYKNQVIDTAKYLYEALPDNQSNLKKIHAPMIFITAMQAMEDGVSPKKFGGWVQLFMNNKPTKYTATTSSSTAKADTVATRINEIKKHYNSNIGEVGNYEKPVPKETIASGKRGRPAKPVLEVVIEQKTAQTELEQQTSNTQEDSFNQEETAQENLINNNTNTDELLQDAV